MIPKPSRPSMQVTMYGVGNNHNGNRIDDGSRISRGKKCFHLTIPMSLAYIEEPGNNDNSFSSKQDNLLGSLGLGKYSGSGEHFFDQSHCSPNFSGGFLSAGSKINEMTHRERKSRLVPRRGSKNIDMVGMAGDKYGVGAYNGGFKKGGYKSQL